VKEFLKINQQLVKNIHKVQFFHGQSDQI